MLAFIAVCALALPVRAQVAGTLDAAFNPVVGSGTPRVDGTAVQPDGKIIIDGGFSTVHGQSRNRIARLNSDGTLESTATFDPGTGADLSVNCVAVQADGKILVGGPFTTFDGQPRNGLARLHANGAVEDTVTFNPGTGPGGSSDPMKGIAVQPDGKIIIVGNFTSVNGQPRGGIARLNPDGTPESTATFNPGTGASGGGVASVVVQADGKIVIGGNFTTLNGQPRNRIARLHSDGSLESTATFNPGTGANVIVYCVALQEDGKILLGGAFSNVNGQARKGIARLNADGTVESAATFNVGTGTTGGSYFGRVHGMAVQANGKILIGGDFTAVNGQARKMIARLNSNGSVESTATFNPGTGVSGTDEDTRVEGVTIQGGGNILLSGFFTGVNGQSRLSFAQLANDAATQTLTIPDVTKVQWMRGGAAPEVGYVTFELSIDGGANWTPLGSGTRIAGGWERAGLSLPGGSQIRARGRTAGGFQNGSSGIVEQTATVPLSLYEQWKLTHLGSASAPDLDDPDRDGSATLAEYGVNTLPGTPGGAPFEPERFLYAEGERLRLFIERDPAHNDVTVEILAADDPTGQWAVIAASALGAPFSGPGYVGGDGAGPSLKTVEIRDTVNIADAPARFLRARVTH